MHTFQINGLIQFLASSYLNVLLYHIIALVLYAKE